MIGIISNGIGTDNGSTDSLYMTGIPSNESIDGINYNTISNNSSNVNINNNLDGNINNNNLERLKQHDWLFQK